MDAVTPTRLQARHAADPAPALPPPAPLAMPTQSLSGAVARPARPAQPSRLILLRRLFLIGLTVILTLGAAHEMYLTLSIGGLTSLEIAVLGLYLVLFAWIAFSFASALGGLLATLRGGRTPLGIDPDAPLPALTSRTALLVPTYNEEPHRLMARIQAIDESLAALGAGDHFDVFILSDTTDPDIWLAEEAAWLALRRHDGTGRPIYYRRRRSNEGRKAGNIAEWVQRFGAAYDHMLILDADSLMTGDTIVRLAAAMERNPTAGLIQTHPIIINATTVFGRIQQFAGRLYGPVIAAGVAWWQGADGNYWGHNAIIRTRAFAECAGLPRLNGPHPIGGHILSHDFIEAALMRRGGWGVHMVTHLGGSYEECPPTIPDYATRDRRWCQGNLQHSGVVAASGLHWVSRLHLMIGIGSYIAAPLWLMFLLVGILISLQAQFIRPEYFPHGFSLFPQWPAQDPVRAAGVFVATMTLLLLPKLFGALAALPRRSLRRGFGGGFSLLRSLIVEMIVSGLIAPVMMLIQSAGVAGILVGKDSGWNAQRRDGDALPARVLVRHFGGYTACGLVMALAAYGVSLSLFLWMTPVIIGLVLTIPLALWTSDPEAGERLRRAHILDVPEEVAPPPILLRANALAAAAPAPAHDPVRALAQNEDLAAAHRAMLPERGDRPPGDIDVPLLVATAKLEQARSWTEAARLLNRQEKLAALSDPDAFDRVVALVRQGRHARRRRGASGEAAPRRRARA